ncbi:amino acid ABC transporter permease [Xinfangfangia sp. D13-10-4-6]|uniref:amino acid ABC transporter permease n=1 Tax=Pseudogemmobacter hezensis TaxID=2737662 RepID=UPI001552714B|nr:amino acid ABC transporter permease [Pseudogemmobacter hezensis]NPD16977.1 amino acid ABC transporter permease [Pseudogemmobacter hezensis]
MSVIFPQYSSRMLLAPLVPLLRSLFGGALNTVLTLLAVLMLALILPPLLHWAVTDAVFSGTQEECRQAAGACWAFVQAKARFILFAFYPSEALWRPILVIALLLGMMVASALPRFWGMRLILGWPLMLALAWWLMAGGWGLAKVSLNSWGGLPVTLLVWSTCMIFAFPAAVLLALARQSRMAGLRLLAVAYIEVMRAIPMVAILYFAMLILPMALPQGVILDKLIRATILIALFWTAYLAEVVRGGLQTIGPGQAEAAQSLGLGYWRLIQLVVLPQALRRVIPGLVNLGIGFLLATSLLAVIGAFDLLNTARASTTDQQWLGFYNEAYIFAAVIYFLLCFAGSRYSLWLEARLQRG